MANYVITPNSFSGNNSVSVSGESVPNTGRVAKRKTVVFSGTGVSPQVRRTFNHAGKPEFVSFTNGTTISASKEGGQLTVTGKSNSQKLQFTWVGDSKDAEISSTYTAGGKSTSNGQDIAGDPGASAEYDFSVNLTIPENAEVDEVIRTLKVSNGASVSAQIQIEQAAGDAFLTVDPEEEQTMAWDGTAITFNVKSNTDVTVTIE